MVTVILVLIFLGILITVHEFGHFFACRISNINVEEFSIGFGPRLFSFKDKHGTQYSLSLIPFGGFVKIQGEEKSGAPSPGDFWPQPFYKKMFVVISGPLFNLVLAIVTFILGYSVVGYETVPLYSIYAVGNPASGFIKGDSVISIDGKTINTVEDLYYYYSKRDTHTVKVIRNNEVVDITSIGRNFDSLNVVFNIPPLVHRVEKGSPAFKAGIKVGDLILKFNDVEVSTWNELVDSIRHNAGHQIVLTVLRSNDTLLVPLQVGSEASTEGVEIGRIGILAPSIRKRLNLVDAVSVSVVRSAEVTWTLIVYLVGLFVGKVPVSSLGGPIMIGKVIYSVSSYGLFQLLYLLGLISINLFIINLLPIPALDGWHFWVYFLEGILRREFSPEVKRIIQFVGFSLLIALMIVITIFDILRVFH